MKNLMPTPGPSCPGSDANESLASSKCEHYKLETSFGTFNIVVDPTMPAGTIRMGDVTIVDVDFSRQS